MLAKPAPSVEGRDEAQTAVFALGLIVIVLGAFAVVWAVAVGPALTVILGLALIALAWFVPTAHSARVLRYLVGALGACAVFAALLALVS